MLRVGGSGNTMSIAALMAASIVLGACAHRGPPPDPQAQACLDAAPSAPKRASAPQIAAGTSYVQVLGSLRRRADAFGACMVEHGYVLDEAKVDKELLRLEQSWNSDQSRGDPQQAKNLREQEVRADPAYWHPGARN
jgi:hypothetical protein